SSDTRRQAFPISPIDLELRAGLDGRVGELAIDLAVRDPAPVATLSANVQMEFAALADRGRRLDALRAAHVAGHLAVPRRSVKAMPQPLADWLSMIDGEFALDADALGDLAHPFMAVRAMGWQVAYAPSYDHGRSAAPIDIDAFALYDGHEATLDARVLGRNTSLVDLAARVRVAAPDVFRWRGGEPPPWR